MNQTKMTNSNSPRFLQPDEVVELALSKHRTNGTIRMRADEDDELYDWPLRKPVDMANLPADRYAARLIALARSIAGTISQIGVHIEREPLRTEACLQELAVILSSYLDDPQFIKNATDLIRVRGTTMQLPNLPAGSPWRWVPEMRTGLHHNGAVNH